MSCVWDDVLEDDIVDVSLVVADIDADLVCLDSIDLHRFNSGLNFVCLSKRCSYGLNGYEESTNTEELTKRERRHVLRRRESGTEYRQMFESDNESSHIDEKEYEDSNTMTLPR